MHVAEEPTTVFIGYASSSLLDTLYKVADEKARKVLVHYGHKAQEAGVKFKMMKGTNSNPGELICKAIENYGIDNCVLGRRGLGSFERFFAGSTSRYVMENAECDVIIVKRQFGPAEEHGSYDLKARVIQAEEHERLRRLEEAEEIPEIEHDVTIDEIKEAEETERARRVKELKGRQIPGDITHFQFQDDILKLGREKAMQETQEKSARKLEGGKTEGKITSSGIDQQLEDRKSKKSLKQLDKRPEKSIDDQSIDFRKVSEKLEGQISDAKLDRSKLRVDDDLEKRSSTGEKHSARLRVQQGSVPKEDPQKRSQLDQDSEVKAKMMSSAGSHP